MAENRRGISNREADEEDDATVAKAIEDASDLSKLSPDRVDEVIEILRAAILKQRAQENPR